MNCFLKGLKFAFFVLLAKLGLSVALMLLWNWLFPPLFGWHAITFWQAVGILILSKILFGGFCRSGSPMFWKHRMMERMGNMTPEERERFRHGLLSRCAPCTTDIADEKSPKSE